MSEAKKARAIAASIFEAMVPRSGLDFERLSLGLGPAFLAFSGMPFPHGWFGVVGIVKVCLLDLAHPSRPPRATAEPSAVPERDRASARSSSADFIAWLISF